MTPVLRYRHAILWTRVASIIDPETVAQLESGRDIFPGVAEALQSKVNYIMSIIETEQSRLVGYQQECDAVEQTLGRALGYPLYADDPKNFPEAMHQDGVCVGEHVPSTIAAEAVAKINSLKFTLATAAVRFREYEHSHKGKRTQDGDAKAARNAEMALACETALGQHNPADYT